MNKQELIDLHRFRDTFNINLQKIKSICAVLNIVIDKQGSVQYIPLLNETRKRMNDCLLLYAIGEQEVTGKLENTKSNELEEKQYLICVDKAEIGRTNYVFVMKNEGAITKKQQNAIDIIPSITTEDKTADFIQALSLAISKSISEAQKPITAPQQELYDAMGKKYLLTNEQLGKLLGLSKSTISSKPDEWRKLGFRYTKVKEEGSSTTLWKISQ